METKRGIWQTMQMGFVSHGGLHLAVMSLHPILVILRLFCSWTWSFAATLYLSVFSLDLFGWFQLSAAVSWHLFLVHVCINCTIIETDTTNIILGTEVSTLHSHTEKCEAASRNVTRNTVRVTVSDRKKGVRGNIWITFCGPSVGRLLHSERPVVNKTLITIHLLCNNKQKSQKLLLAPQKHLFHSSLPCSRKIKWHQPFSPGQTSCSSEMLQGCSNILSMFVGESTRSCN